MHANTFYRLVGDELDFADRARARLITEAVLQALRDRLTPEEGRDARAQLPAPLKLLWGVGPKRRRPIRMHRRQFYARVRTDAGLRSEREARDATLAVFAALKEQLSPGEAEDIAAQLPKDLKDVWTTAQLAA